MEKFELAKKIYEMDVDIKDARIITSQKYSNGERIGWALKSIMIDEIRKLNTHLDDLKHLIRDMDK